MAVQRGASSAGFWDFDEPLPPLRRRFARAAAVAAVWIVSALPALAGQRCPIAAAFHVPCPGCGMTRALRLLAGGHTAESLRMNPAAVPVLLAGLTFIAATVWSTGVTGSPLRMLRTRSGPYALAFVAVAYGAAFVVWGLRWFGALGGPVAV